MFTNRLPAEVTWTGQYHASSGTISWDGANNRLLWNSLVELGAPVSITFQVQVKPEIPGGDTITNIATLDDGVSFTFLVRAPDVAIVSPYLYLPLVWR